MIKRNLLIIALCLFWLVACQSHIGSGVKVITQAPVLIPSKTSVAPSVKPVVQQIHSPGIYGRITSTKDRATSKDLKFEVTLPKRSGFNTKAIDCSNISFLKVMVEGINMGAPLYPTGVDGFNMIAPASPCSAVVTVPNVPYGAARIGTFEAYDAGRTLIPGAVLKAVFDVNADPTNVEITFRSTPNGKVVEQILGSPNPLIASHMDLSDLATLVDGITGQGGTFPNYTYTTHPALVNIANLVTDLLGNGGDSSALSSGNAAYKLSPATVTGTIAGLAGNDTAQIHITDPASPITVGNGNGAFSFTSNVKDGSWTVFAIGVGGTKYTASGTPAAVVGAGGSVDVGTITLTPELPLLETISTNSGFIADTIVLRGAKFHSEAAGNTVKFGTLTVPTVDVTVVNTTELSVKVPTGSGSNLAVTVNVGSQTSTSKNFSILPKVTTVTPGSGFTDEVIEITITGEGFQAGSNVNVGPYMTTNIIFDSINQLRATVSGISAGTYGVKVNNPGPFSGEKPTSYTGNDRSFSFNVSGTPTGSNPIFALVVDHTTTSTLYAGTDGTGGMYKSTNSGLNWSLIDTGLTDPDVQVITMHPTDNTILYAGTLGGGVFKTTDSGANWTQINTGLGDLDVRDIAIDPATPTTIYVGTSGGDRLYKSTDSGANWTTSGVVNGLASNAVRSIAIDPGTPATLYAGHASSGIYKSTDSGGTWTQLTTGIAAGAKVFDIAIDPLVNSTVLAISDQQVCRSTDSGTNFSCVGAGNGLPASALNALAFNPTAPAIVFVGSTNQIYYSIDNGINWSLRSTGLVGTDATAIAFDPLLPTTIYAGTESGVQKTTDTGLNWNAVTTAIGNSNIRSLTMDPVTTSILYSGTANGIYKTTDSGSTWTLSSTGLPGSNSWSAIAVDPGTPATLYAGSESNGLWKSTDSGANWSQLTTGISATAAVWDMVIDPAANNKLYVIDDQQICNSSDSGANFTCVGAGGGLPASAITGLGIAPSGSPIYAAINGEGVYKSTDGGANWTNITGLVLDTNNIGIFVDPNDANILYAPTHGGDGLYKSTNAGLNWEKAWTSGLTDTNSHTFSINSANSNILLIGNHGGLFRSTDGGDTWVDITGSVPTFSGVTNYAKRIVINPSDQTKVYVGSDSNGIYKSF